jgi:hypothetical protein
VVAMGHRGHHKVSKVQYTLKLTVHSQAGKIDESVELFNDASRDRADGKGNELVSRFDTTERATEVNFKPLCMADSSVDR